MASLPLTIFHLSAFRRPTRRSSGVALVIVLAFLVLLSGLVVAFFITTTTDVVSSRNYAQETTAKELSDAAVNLVMSQITDATAGFAAGAGSTGTLAWASQPGMIRTWDDAGNFFKAFKLYSSDQLVSSGTDFDPTADATALGTWNAGAPGKPYNALYADLNSPVMDIAGSLHYPIMDPSGDDGGMPVATGDTTSIEGFHITPLPGAKGGAASPGNNPAAMPVKWLYVLADGTLAPTAAGAVSGTHVTVGTTATNTPNTANPIVGRVAFWTDDDTCKVNLNTASEGVFWDVPRTNTYEDDISNDGNIMGYASAVPSSTEFQRVPGHPATTSLSTVLGYHFGRRPGYLATGDPSGYYAKFFQPYYDLLPRVATGGTKGGTIAGSNPDGSTNTAAAGPNIVGRRLFASVDELLFAPPTAGNAATTAPGAPLVVRPTNGVDGGGTAAFTKGDIEKVRFFLTTNSRAPDVNLYNKPRISLWPLLYDPASDATQPSLVRNAKDDLLAFCASVGVDPAQAGKLDPRTSKVPYYFQRYQPFVHGGQIVDSDPTHNNPGTAYYASPGSSQNPYDDLSQNSVRRNLQLLNYLHTLTNLNVPGFGGKFADKYPQDNDQILTEAFDYIRSTVNTTSLNSPNTFTVNNVPYTSNYNYAPNTTTGDQTGIGAGSVVPIYTSTAIPQYKGLSIPSTPTMGFGRWSVISEVSILLWATEMKDTSTFGAVVNNVQQPPTLKPDGTALPDGLPDDEPLFLTSGGVLTKPRQVYYRGVGMPRTKSIEAAFIITPTTVTPGNPVFCPALRYEVRGLNTFTVTWNKNQANLNLPADAIQTIHSETGVAYDAESNFYDQFTYDLGENTPHSPITAMSAALASASTSGMLGADGLTPAPIQRNPPAPMSLLNPFVSTAPAQIGGYDISPTTVDTTNYPPPCAYQPNWNEPNQQVPNSDPTKPAYGAPYNVSNQPPGPDAYGDTLPIHDHPYIWAGDGATVANPDGGLTALKNLPYTMDFSGGTIQITVYSGLYPQINAANPADDSSAQPVQTYTLFFPRCTVPVPQVVRAAFGPADFGTAANPPKTQVAAALQSVMKNGIAIGLPTDPNLDFYTGWTIPTASGNGASSWNATPLYNASTNPSLQNLVPWNTRFPPFPQGTLSAPTVANPSGPAPVQFYIHPEETSTIARTGDVVRSLSLDPTGPTKGDYRLLAATHDVPSNYFAPMGYTDPTTTPASTRYGVYGKVNPYWQDMYWMAREEASINYRDTGDLGYSDDVLTASNNYGDPRAEIDVSSTHNFIVNLGANLRLWPSRDVPGSRGTLVKGVSYGNNSSPVVAHDLNGAMMVGGDGAQVPGDWDNGTGNYYDGAYINKADEGYGLSAWDNPYYPSNYHATGGTGGGDAVQSYTPNRQVASPVMFGSLPTGVIGTNNVPRPWQTLLFCPNPAAGDDHPGFGSGSNGAGPSAMPPYTVPPDHVFLDLFYMPVVEPYAISEAFSTAGRVNMNYQIQPFTNVERSTAVRAVLKDMKIQAISAATAQPGTSHYYKSTFDAQNASSWSSRYDINVDATLTGFTNRFAKSDLFHSASEICNVFLVPQNPDPGAGYPWTPPQQVEGDAPGSYAATDAWWSNYKITGDNTRESPYNQVYPRLTTKSNTFTVHMRVQMLKKQAGSAPATWDETKDQVLSEYRGSASLERYIDPNDPNLPDFATGIPANGGMALASIDPKLNMDSYYRFRLVSTKQFQP